VVMLPVSNSAMTPSCTCRGGFRRSGRACPGAEAVGGGP
jgi:hypothetical protein